MLVPQTQTFDTINDFQWSTLESKKKKCTCIFKWFKLRAQQIQRNNSMLKTHAKGKFNSAISKISVYKFELF